MIDLHGQISMGFLKKRGFTGSYKGMRYLLLGRSGLAGTV